MQNVSGKMRSHLFEAETKCRNGEIDRIEFIQHPRNKRQARYKNSCSKQRTGKPSHFFFSERHYDPFTLKMDITVSALTTSGSRTRNSCTNSRESFAY